jgi:hypothetical protein
VFPRSAASVSRAFTAGETQIPIPLAATIDVLIEVRDAGSYQAGASYGGWHYDQGIGRVFDDAYRV